MNVITFLISWVSKNSHVISLKLCNLASFKNHFANILWMQNYQVLGICISLQHQCSFFNTLYLCGMLSSENKAEVCVQRTCVVFLLCTFWWIQALSIFLSLCTLECLYEENMIRIINKLDIQMFVYGVRKLNTDVEMYIFTYSYAIFTYISLAIFLSFQKAVFDYLFA